MSDYRLAPIYDLYADEIDYIAVQVLRQRAGIETVGDWPNTMASLIRSMPGRTAYLMELINQRIDAYNVQ